MSLSNHDPQKVASPKSPWPKKSLGRERTFVDFILSQRVMQSPRGELLALFKTLINAGAFPTIDSWADLYGFMTGRHACPEAIAEGRKLWREYQKAMSPRRIKRERQRHD